MLTASKLDPKSLRGWKVVIGGAALPRALARQALDLGIDILTGYGMSETCPVLTLSHLDDEMLKLDLDRQAELRCMTGRPIDLVELRVVDEQMRDVPHDGNTPGEIVVRAPWRKATSTTPRIRNAFGRAAGCIRGTSPSCDPMASCASRTA